MVRIQKKSKKYKSDRQDRIKEATAKREEYQRSVDQTLEEAEEIRRREKEREEKEDIAVAPQQSQKESAPKKTPKLVAILKNKKGFSFGKAMFAGFLVCVGFSLIYLGLWGGQKIQANKIDSDYQNKIINEINSNVAETAGVSDFNVTGLKLIKKVDGNGLLVVYGTTSSLEEGQTMEVSFEVDSRMVKKLNNSLASIGTDAENIDEYSGEKFLDIHPFEARQARESIDEISNDLGVCLTESNYQGTEYSSTISQDYEAE